MDINTGMESTIVKAIREKEHIHAETELVYVIEGQLQAAVRGAQYHLRKNDFILFNSGISHSITADRNTIICVVRYSCELLSALFQSEDYRFDCISLQERTGHSTRQSKALIELFQEIVYRHIDQTHRTDCLKRGLLYRLLDLLFDRYLQEEPAGAVDKADDDTRIRRILRYVEQNFRENISLSELAEQLFVSTSTLSRLFKKQTGSYFADYVSQVRLRYAVNDLLFSDKNITRIAVDSGFSNLSVFNRVFRKKYDMAPTDYRREKKKAAGANKEEKRQTEELICLELKKMQAAQTNPVSAVLSAEADVSGGIRYEKTWNKTINVGAMNTLMLANTQYHLMYLVENLGFRYARLWNVFSSKMMLTDGKTIDNYYYDKADMVLDFLVSHHIIPFLDMGVRPNAAVRTEDRPVFYEEEYISFQSRQAWEAMVSDFIRHLTERYGTAEISRWVFELCNDPVHNTKCYADENYSYFNAYHYLYQTVKRAVPEAAVGGPMGISGWSREFIGNFLRTCKKEGCVPDFVSFLLFPYLTTKEEGRTVYKRNPDPAYEKEQAELMHALLRESETECRIYITEWNNSVSSRNFLNDGCFRAAYMVRTLSQLWDSVDMISVWMASDWVSNYFDAKGIANGGNGLLTKDTICKPAYYALAFLNSLGGYLIERKDAYIITKTEHDSYYILCCNYKKFNFSYFIEDEDINTPEKSEEIFEDSNKLELHITLNHIPGEKYIIKKRTVNDREGSLLSEWKKFQYDSNISSQDVKYIRQACYPRMSMEKTEVKHHRLEIFAELEPHEITLFHIFEARHD